MFQKILIANRGEIAVRIIRACRNMGIRSVAVYSKEDKDSLHVQLADQRICIGEGPARNSYLNMERIVTAALNMGADAIHPGFGFLSENADFVRLCEKNGLTFIGPKADVIDSMGNKSHARKTMMEAGVPVVPGTKEPVYDAETGIKLAEEIGYPVMIKASSGGGGKGMRVANPPMSLNSSLIWLRESPPMHSATTRCTLRNSSRIPVMWRFRSWEINSAMWWLLASVTVRCREIIRS